jgi:hypothetical protein
MKMIDMAFIFIERSFMALLATRALRGTKTLTRAFYDAADTIPLDKRPAVVKAALASIRDDLKVAREKAKVAKAKTAAMTTKKPSVAKIAVRKLPKAA